MRKVMLLLAAAAAFAACDPGIKKFDVVPQALQCPGPVKITWDADDKGIHLTSDAPVTPPLADVYPKSGTLTENVSQTTQFHLYYPGAAHREKSVTVAKPLCGGTCGPQTLTFTGTCMNAQSGPTYITVNVNPLNAPGNLVNLTNDADYPIHVLHDGLDIALGAGGGPLLPLPAVGAAGDYSIYIPGQVGVSVCQGAGPTQGTTDAPVVHLFVTPTCP